ncbi:Hypothetical predicted protein, partial [Olea europaea subsp. europaea]
AFYMVLKFNDVALQNSHLPVEKVCETKFPTFTYSQNRNPSSPSPKIEGNNSLYNDDPTPPVLDN